MTEEARVCTKCGEKKPTSEFYRHKHSKSGFYSVCTKCTLKHQNKYYCKHDQQRKEYANQYRSNHRDTILKYNRDKRFKKYGLTKDQFLEILDRQNNLCAICHKKPPVDIDHDHRTGRVRGILCRRCNAAIGVFDDSIDLLRNSISYLEYWSK